MARGIIYCMTTIVPGLVKIGKTRTDQFEQRMYQLENNGYRNIGGLKRRFAIEVADYDEKEVLLHDIFSKSNVPNTELFALEADLVVQLLASLDGKQIYPQTITKEEALFRRECEWRAGNSLWNRAVIAFPAKKTGCRRLGRAQSLKMVFCKKMFPAALLQPRAGSCWGAPITAGLCGRTQRESLLTYTGTRQNNDTIPQIQLQYYVDVGSQVSGGNL